MYIAFLLKRYKISRTWCILYKWLKHDLANTKLSKTRCIQYKMSKNWLS